MIDGSASCEQDDSKSLIKGEEFVLCESSLFKKTITYDRFRSLGNYHAFTFKHEVPIVAGGLRRLFGEEVGNYLGQYVSSKLLNEDELDSMGISVWRSHPNFLKVRFR